MLTKGQTMDRKHFANRINLVIEPTDSLFSIQ